MKSAIEVLKDVQANKEIYKVIPEPVLVAGLLDLDQKIRKLEQCKQDKPIDPADYIDKKELERGKMQNKLHGVLAGAGENYHEKAEKIYRLLQELE
jgi:hypothetical protein